MEEISEDEVESFEDKCTVFSPFHFLSDNFTAQNTVISPNFMVRKFFGKAQFPHHEIR